MTDEGGATRTLTVGYGKKVVVPDSWYEADKTVILYTNEAKTEEFVKETLIYADTGLYVESVVAVMQTDKSDFNYSQIPPKTDKEKLATGVMEGDDNKFLTVVTANSVEWRTGGDGGAAHFIQVGGEALQVTFKGTGTFTIALRGTGSSANAAIYLKNTETGTYAKLSEATKDKAKYVLDGPIYNISSASHISVTFEVAEAGTYIFGTYIYDGTTAEPDGNVDKAGNLAPKINGGYAINETEKTSTTKYGNARLSVISMVDNYKVPKIAVNEVKIEQGASADLALGGTLQLTATVKPDNATEKTVTWTSSNESVATVDENGKVTAVAQGLVTITATADGVPATITIDVGGFAQAKAEKLTQLQTTYPKENYTITEGANANEAAYKNAMADAETNINAAKTGVELEEVYEAANAELGNIINNADAEKQHFTVTLMNGDTQFDSITAVAGDTINEPANEPTAAGKNFKGWFYTADDGTETQFVFAAEGVKNATVVNSNMTLTAKFVDAVTVTFVFGIEGKEDIVLSLDKVEGGSTVTADDRVSAPTRDDGLTFGGWFYTADDGTETQFVFAAEGVTNATKVSANMTLTAKWQSAKVIFNPKNTSKATLNLTDEKELVTLTSNIDYLKTDGSTDYTNCMTALKGNSSFTSVLGNDFTGVIVVSNIKKSSGAVDVFTIKANKAVKVVIYAVSCVKAGDETKESTLSWGTNESEKVAISANSSAATLIKTEIELAANAEKTFTFTTQGDTRFGILRLEIVEV